MAWPNPDLDGVRFNQDDAGWLEIESIFTAIKERAVATGHSLASGAYSGTFALELWHADPDGDTDRDYLKDLYEQFHTDLDALIDGDANIRWTEGSGDTTEWTLASLTTDIGMGDFADLLTRAANPDPLLWLRAALERLIYAKVTETVDSSAAEAVFRGYQPPTYTNGDGASYAAAWTDMVADSDHTDDFSLLRNRILWRVFTPTSNHAALALQSTTPLTVTNTLLGVLAALKYKVLISNVGYTGSTFYITVGGSASTDIAGEATGAFEILGDVADLPLNTTTDFSAQIDESFPGSYPFTDPAGGFREMNVSFTSAIFFVDLATILADQA